MGARRRPGANIGATLRAELADAAGGTLEPGQPLPEVQRVLLNTWRLNYNGQAVENLPRHVEASNGGTLTVADLDEFESIEGLQADANEWPFVSRSQPGDHPRCHCGWEARWELVVVQP